jgi:PBP1b-binding outer membrane lipoprotein LpoB
MVRVRIGAMLVAAIFLLAGCVDEQAAKSSDDGSSPSQLSRPKIIKEPAKKRDNVSDWENTETAQIDREMKALQRYSESGSRWKAMCTKPRPGAG